MPGNNNGNKGNKTVKEETVKGKIIKKEIYQITTSGGLDINNRNTISNHEKLTVKINGNNIPYYKDYNSSTKVGQYINIPKDYLEKHEITQLFKPTKDDIVLEKIYGPDISGYYIFSSKEYKYVLLNSHEYGSLYNFKGTLIRIPREIAKKKNIIVYRQPYFSTISNKINYEIIDYHNNAFVELKCVNEDYDYPNIRLHIKEFPIFNEEERKKTTGAIFSILKKTADEYKRVDNIVKYYHIQNNYNNIFRINNIKSETKSEENKKFVFDKGIRYTYTLKPNNKKKQNIETTSNNYPHLFHKKIGNIVKVPIEDENTKIHYKVLEPKLKLTNNIKKILKLTNNTKNNNNIFTINNIKYKYNETRPGGPDGDPFINTYTLKPNNKIKQNIKITSNNYPTLKNKVKIGNKVRVPKRLVKNIEKNNMNKANN